MELTDNQKAKWAQRLAMPNPDRSDVGSELPLTAAALDLECADLRQCVARTVALSRALATERLIVKVPVEAHPDSLDHAPVDVASGARAELETVETPYGPAVPAFSSVEELKAWDSMARPMTMPASRVAVMAAVTEGSGAVVINPGSRRQVVLPRSAVLALAADDQWLPIVDDHDLCAQLLEVGRAAFPGVVGVKISPTQESALPSNNALRFGEASVPDGPAWDGAVQVDVYVDLNAGPRDPYVARNDLALALAQIAANPRLKEGAAKVDIVPRPVLAV